MLTPNKSVSKNKKLGIIGASGHGRVIYDIAKLCGLYDEIVFFDDAVPSDDKIKCIGDCKLAYSSTDEYDFIVAIGNQNIRKSIYQKLKEHNAFVATLVHPNAIVSSRVVMGEGTVVMAGAVINTDSTIGKGCIINTTSSIDHDCQIGDFVHISVGAHVCGTVCIGDNTWVGAGSTIINNVSVCDNCFLGAGTVVVKSISLPGKYVGIPSKMKK